MWLKTFRCMVTTSYILKKFDTIWQSLIIHEENSEEMNDQSLFVNRIKICFDYIDFSFVFDFLGLDNVYPRANGAERRSGR